jgi:predicted nucleic acid-binding protein
VRFWDSSAILPLLVDEGTTTAMTREHRRDPAILVWWATTVECTSALARREREGSLDSAGMSEALDRLAELERAWTEVHPVERVRAQATRLLRVHALTSADALQLAAALVAGEDQPRTLPMVTLDERLALAAEREGFVVVGGGAESA